MSRTTPPGDVHSPAISGQGAVESIGERRILRLPSDASLRLPSRGQVAVEATLNGRPLSTVVEPDGRRGHWIAVDRDLHGALQLSDGDPVTFELVPAEVWPEPEVPRDLADALREAPDIADLWKAITPMARWEWVRWVQATRSPATRARRVEVAVSKLRDGKRRPCCFDLSSCTDPDLAKSGKLPVTSSSSPC